MTKRKAKDSKKENSQSVQSKVWKADERQCVCVSVTLCSLIVWELGCRRPPERQRGKWRREISTSGKSTTARNPEPLIAADQEYAVFCICHCILLLYLYFPSSLRASWPQEVRPSLWESASCDNLSQPLTTHVSSHPSSHTPWKLLKALENTKI